MKIWIQCSVLRVRSGGEAQRKEAFGAFRKRIILDSSMVEHSAVNRVVVGSSPTRGGGKSL